MTALSATEQYASTSKVDFSSSNSNFKKTSAHQTSATWDGRAIKSVVQSFLLSPIYVAQAIINAAGSVTKDPNTLASVLRRLNCQVLDAIALARTIPASLYKFKAAGTSYIGFVDTLGVLGDLQYFSRKDYKKDSNLQVAGRSALAVANAGGALLWFEELKFFKLSHIAHKLGEVRLFSKVPTLVKSIPLVRDIPHLTQAANSLGKVHVFSGLKNLSMCLIAARALVLYYLFSALNSMRKIAQTHDAVERKQAGLDLSYYASELALNSLLIVGVASTAGLGALGATCVATGLASFTYRNYK